MENENIDLLNIRRDLERLLNNLDGAYAETLHAFRAVLEKLDRDFERAKNARS